MNATMNRPATTGIRMPLFLTKEEVLLLLEMCVSPAAGTQPDSMETEELLERLGDFYRGFGRSAEIGLAAVFQRA